MIIILPLVLQYINDNMNYDQHYVIMKHFLFISF